MSTQSMRRRLSLGALAVAVCAAGPVAAQSSLIGPGHTVTVQNNHSKPLKVYLQDNDNPVEMTLGTVEGNQTATMAIPDWAIQDESRVTLGVQPEGGAPFEGDAFVKDMGPNFGVMYGHTGRRMKTDDRMWAAIPDVNATTVTVRNESEHATKVFLNRGTHGQRMGEVPAYTEMTFQVPEGFVGLRGEVELVSEEGGVLSSSMLDLEHGRHFGIRID